MFGFVVNLFRVVLLFSTERHYQNISVTFSLGEFKEIAPRRKLKEPTKTSTADPAEEDDYGREAKSDDQVFPCPKEGCTRSFQRHCSLEKHLAFGTCTKTVERETLLDKAKVKYAARLEEGSSSVPTIPLPPETCPRNTGYVTPPEGFALKQVKKAYRFNEKQREYLTARFTIGQESGKKVDAEIVATEMRRAKGLNGERLFSVSEFLTTQQVASFFSRMAAKVKQQTAPCAQAVTEQDLVAMEEEFNLSNAKESVFEQLNVTHPIHYQQYNICSMVKKSTLKNLKLAILKLLSKSFNLALPSGVDQRKKTSYIALLEDLVRCCSCSAV